MSNDDPLRAEFEAWAAKEWSFLAPEIRVIAKLAYHDGHASGVKVGLERAREICEDRATRLMQTAVHAASYGATQCTDAIQREIEKWT